MAKLQTVIRDQLDERCDRFEAEWKAGRRPGLRTFLADWEGPNAEQLFRHLLELDVDYRKRAGEQPEIADYEAEFPQYFGIIKEVVWQPGLAETRALGSGDTKPAGTAPVPQPTTLAGYELLGVLGQGGMGIVYKARQTRLNRLVAVKMLLSGGEASAEEVQRFHVEAQAAAALDHPHIVPIYEVGEQAGRHYFSMAYIEGPSLAHQMRKETFQIPAAVAMVRTIAEAVHYAHTQGIIHRDLKPANILLGNDGRPRVSDFGLAKTIASEGELTTTGQILGTPYYMAPEQAAGRVRDITPATDVYALGTILYEMLVNRVPFRDPSVWETIQQVIQAEPVSPRLLNRSVPRDLETIVLKALDKQPRSRFASAQDFADDLGRFLRDEPIHARPVSRWEKGVRWARKNRTVATLLAVVLGLVLITATGAAVGGIIYRAQEREKSQLAGEKEQLKTQSSQLVKETTTLKEQSRSEKYLSDMVLAGEALQIPSGIGRVREFVDPWAKDTAQPDLRGWEWHLLRAAAHEEWNFIEIKTPDGIYVPLSTIAFHPREEIIAFGGPTGELFVGPIEGGGIETGGEHENYIRSVAWHPSGSRLATASNDGRVILWELHPLRKADEIDFAKKPVYAVAYSPNGKLLAAGVHDDGVHVFNAATKEPIAHPADQVDSQPALAFSPRSDYLAISAHPGGADYQIQLWNTTSWQNESLAANRSLIGHEQQISRIAWSRSGRQLASASFDRTIKLWDVPAASLIHTFDSHQKQVTSVQFTRNDRELVSVGWDHSFRRFDIATKRQTYLGRGHTKQVEWCDLNPQGDLLASVGDDGVVRLWDLREPARTIVERKHPRQTNNEDPYPLISWRHDGSQLAASNSSETCIWKSNEAARFDFEVGALPQWSAGDRYYALWKGDSLEVRDTGGQEAARAFSSPEQGFGHCRAVWSQRGAQLLISTGTQLHAWDLTNPARQLATQLHDVKSLACSPDDSQVLVGCKGGTVHAFRIADGERLFSFKPHGSTPVVGVAWSPEGGQFITCLHDRDPVVWNAATREQLFSLAGHAACATQAAWSPDGARIATAGSDATVRIWTAAGEQTLVLKHPEPVAALAWSPDGQQLASLSHDGTILVHDARLSYEDQTRKDD